MSNIAIFEQLKEMKKSIESINEKMTRSDVPPETVEYQRPDPKSLNLGSVVSIDGNENAENVRKEIAHVLCPLNMVSGSKKRPVYPTVNLRFGLIARKAKRNLMILLQQLLVGSVKMKKKKSNRLSQGREEDIQKRDLPGLITFFNIPIADHLEANQMDMDNAIEVCFERPNKNPQNLPISVYVSHLPSETSSSTACKVVSTLITIMYMPRHESTSSLLQMSRFNHHQNNCREDRPTCLHCGGDHYYEQCHLRMNCHSAPIVLKIESLMFHLTAPRIPRCPVYQRIHAKNFPDIKVAQLNVHHSPSALNSFLDYCTHKKIDILIISEPPIRKGVPNINKKFSPFYQSSSLLHLHSQSINSAYDHFTFIEPRFYWQFKLGHHHNVGIRNTIL
ncbi:hypothetical protein DERF_011491 [Dermatophagoides farinae]|uniref:Uncharacterized protein n=1 Tax=Dermatophagoides farinae TaxID=6954 RepID=A0A922HV24_DERFA|nr:hypothetical protein DERF_011491 [Dermatophagoides farinae]